MTAPFDPSAAAAANSGIYGLPHSPADARVVLIPVPWDATTSYRAGTSKGPEAIFEASKQVDLFDVETGRPYETGIAMLDVSEELRALNQTARAQAEPIIAVGGDTGGDPALQLALEDVNRASARLNTWVEETASQWLTAGKIVGVVGGDHASPFGLIRAIARASKGLGILHIDAHADLRVAYEGFTWSHASIMHNVLANIPEVTKLVQVGIRDVCEAEVNAITSSGGRVITHFDTDLAKAKFQGTTSWDAQCSAIVAALPRRVYISFDIDGLDPQLCPNTGTPVPGGLSFAEAAYLIRTVVESGRTIVGFDLNEVAPGPDGDDWDANVGARMLYKLIGWTLKSQGL